MRDKKKRQYISKKDDCKNIPEYVTHKKEIHGVETTHETMTHPKEKVSTTLPGHRHSGGGKTSQWKFTRQICKEKQQIKNILKHDQ